MWIYLPIFIWTLKNCKRLNFVCFLNYKKKWKKPPPGAWGCPNFCIKSKAFVVPHSCKVQRTLAQCRFLMKYRLARASKLWWGVSRNLPRGVSTTIQIWIQTTHTESRLEADQCPGSEGTRWTLELRVDGTWCVFQDLSHSKTANEVFLWWAQSVG